MGALWVAKWPMFLQAENLDSDQTVRILRHTCLLEPYAGYRLRYILNLCSCNLLVEIYEYFCIFLCGTKVRLKSEIMDFLGQIKMMYTNCQPYWFQHLM